MWLCNRNSDCAIPAKRLAGLVSRKLTTSYMSPLAIMKTAYLEEKKWRQRFERRSVDMWQGLYEPRNGHSLLSSLERKLLFD